MSSRALWGSLVRKSNEEAALTRAAIVDAAADQLRRTGIAASSLVDMMAAAGLTHGGFYRHFRNKEHLVAEAVAAAGVKTIATVKRNIVKGGTPAAIRSYLSRSHRDAAVPLCPFAAFGSEVARAGEETRAASIDVIEKLLSALADGQQDEAARDAAIVLLSTLIGAMTLARIAGNTPLSDEILARARDRLQT